MERKISTQLLGKITWDDIPIPLIVTDREGVPVGWNRGGASFVGEMEPSGVSRLPAGKKGDHVWLSGHRYRNVVIPWSLSGDPYLLHLLLRDERPEEREEQKELKDAVSYVADIAHEIRNPLGSIELFASLLRKSLMNENDLRRIDQIIEAVHLINGRITGLIDTMKKKTVHNDKISLGKLLSDILGDPQLWGTFLLCQFTHQDLFIRGDERLLKHLFLVLFVALLSGTPPGAQLEIRTSVGAENEQLYGHVTLTAWQILGDESRPLTWSRS